MQTLEPTREPRTGTEAGAQRFSGGKVGLIAVAFVLVIGIAAAAYATGRSQGSGKTIVQAAAPAASATPSATTNDRGFSKLANGHEAAVPAIEAPLDPATRQLLQHQLTLAREAAMRFPTVAAAEAAGWRRAGPFVPGLGVHFVNLRDMHYVPVGAITDAAILTPTALIFDGTHPSSHIAGLMYVGPNLRIPQGFAGYTDIWHYHTDVCLVIKGNGDVDVPYGIDTTVSKQLCDGVSGRLLQQTPQMLHAWVVAGYDSPQGVFSHENEAMTCRDGTYHMIPISQWGTRSSACVDGGE